MKRWTIRAAALAVFALFCAPTASAQVPGVGGGAHGFHHSGHFGQHGGIGEYAGPVEYAGPAQFAGPFDHAAGPHFGMPGYGGAASPYGWYPFFRILLAKHRYPPVGPVGPPAVQGTLVFPNHPFARGPRDYFMMD